MIVSSLTSTANTGYSYESLTVYESKEASGLSVWYEILPVYVKTEFLYFYDKVKHKRKQNLTLFDR